MADERIDPTNVHPVVWGDHAHRYLWASLLARGVVLDVACGAGYGSEILLGQEQVTGYVGVDIDRGAVLSANRSFKTSDSHFLQGDAAALPIAGTSVDTITCFETLEHVTEPEVLIKEFARVLKPAGLLIGSVPTRALELAVGQVYGSNVFHRSQFTQVRLERLIAKRFSSHLLFEQSLELASLVRNAQSPGGQPFHFAENSRYRALSPGCWLFVASREDIAQRVPDRTTLSSLLAIGSVLDHDRSAVEHVRGLRDQIAHQQASAEELSRAHADIVRQATELSAREALISEQLREWQDRHARLYHQFESLLDGSAASDAAIANLQREREDLVARLDRSAAESQKLRQELEGAQTELNAILNTRSQRLIRGLVRSPAGAMLLAAGRRLVPGLRPAEARGATPAAVSVRPEAAVESEAPRIAAPAPVFSDEEQAWIRDIARRPRPVSVGHPHWWGIRASATQLFDACYFAEDTLDEVSGARLADLLLASECTAVVVQGFPRTYLHAVRSLRARAPHLPVFIVWHGSFVQARLDYDWEAFSQVLALCRDGWFRKLGLVKKGMAEVLAGPDLRTGFIMNRVRDIPAGPSVPLEGGPHLGVWGLWHDNWLKPPFAMLAASRLVPGSTVHSSVISDRVRAFCSTLGIDIRGTGKPIDQNDMPSVLSTMHVNLYVSLSECAPMLPLESLAAGAPCVMGPNSHYFEDNEFLHRHLVVPHPDDAYRIAETAKKAIENRAELVEAYKLYAPEYNHRALESLEAFLEMPVNPP